MKILAINPGSTSTKIAVYEDNTPVLLHTIRHDVEELSRYATVTEQFEFRKDLVLHALEANNVPFAFDAIIGRGGLVKPIPGGVYEVNNELRNDLIHAKRAHASNLGGLIAHELAGILPDCKAYIADPVVVDELDDVARLSGSPLLPRVSIFHALNHKATARRYAKEQGVKYEEQNLIVCHMGGGITVAAHRNGRAVDVNNGLDGEGPYAPERAGTLPAGELINLCFSGKFTQEEVQKMVVGNAGLAAHLGTTNVIEVIEKVKQGDEHADYVLNGMIYNIAKAIGAAAVVLRGKVDAILLTGGLAYSDYLIPKLKAYISFLGTVYVYPGEDEMEALAFNALGALSGELSVKVYK
ncbi:butyrate kinase [Bacteroides sp. 224]|uniref:butyrate kinase n=1 Tax=Bacteroides sp. 224 TaxID=2302936 RepID=UPI0013D22A30|nr:butyrate kinase [Bacteroides sp. 224]NDV63767.1 butyrate kinase [Bacteroides sp. 224]